MYPRVIVLRPLLGFGIYILTYQKKSSKRIYSYIMIVVGGLLSLSIESILPKEEFYLQNLLSLK
jgi:glycopeptide antibiotics resistance protein